MARVPDPVRLKRVLVLMEFGDGSIGAVYSDDFKPEARVDVQRREEPARRWQDADFMGADPEPVFRVRIGDMGSLVVHDPAFHGLTVEATARLAMDQWRLAE